MFKKILVRSVLLVLTAANAAYAENVPGQPAELPGYREGDGRNNQDQSGDINGPQGRGGVYEVGPNQSNPYEPNPYEPNPYQPGRPSRPRPRPGRPNQGYNEIKSIYIGRAVYNEALPLRELAGLDRTYVGSEIVSIRANTQPNSPAQTLVQLVADGRVVAQQINPGYQINIRPNQRLILGQNVRSLQLVINGSTIIQQIDIEISRNGNGGGIGQPYPQPGPGPGPITPPPYNPPGYNPPGYGEQRLNINVNRSTYGDDRIDLNQYIDMQNYSGYAITQIIVSAAPQYDSAFIDLLINDFNQGQLVYNGAYLQQQTLWLQNRAVIGQGADSIVLYTRGNMTVQQVTLVLSR